VAVRLGVFGGTFDPIHAGHLVAAVNVRHLLGLDCVLLTVANQPWQKTGSRPITPAEDRFAMVEAAVAGIPGLEASRIEIDRGGVSYTVDTLSGLRAHEPDAELFFVVGADAAAQVHTWERAPVVASLCTLVIVNRPGVARAPALSGWKVVEVEVPALEISSTDLRARVAKGQPLDFLVPEGVIRCIASRGLYSGGR